ncbi:MAG: hypothetical protein AAB656_02235 [Patescibacteria group bacterium]
MTTITERVENILSERSDSSSDIKQVLKENEVTSEQDKATLVRCDSAMHIFRILEGLEEIHQEVLRGKGELSKDSYIEIEGDNRIAVSKATLHWSKERTAGPARISVGVTKKIGGFKPFELTIESSEHDRFTTSIDTPEEDQLTTDGDIGRWDIRNAEDWDDEFGFYTTPNSLRRGIEERLARVCAPLIA